MDNRFRIFCLDLLAINLVLCYAGLLTWVVMEWTILGLVVLAATSALILWLYLAATK